MSRISVLFLESDYEPGETFRHPSEPCSFCGRLVISGGDRSALIACEDCYENGGRQRDTHTARAFAESNHAAVAVS